MTQIKAPQVGHQGPRPCPPPHHLRPHPPHLHPHLVVDMYASSLLFLPMTSTNAMHGIAHHPSHVSKQHIGGVVQGHAGGPAIHM